MDLDRVIEWYILLGGQWEHSSSDRGQTVLEDAVVPVCARRTSTHQDAAGLLTLQTGKLGALWRFPSDHLPVGCTFDDGLRVVSWNILNSRFSIRNVEGQGLQDSLLYEQYAVAGVGKLKLRDCVVLHILEALIKGPNKASVLALQECSKNMCKALQPVLSRWGFEVASFEGNEHTDDTVVVYDAGLLEPWNLPHFKRSVVKCSPFTSKADGKVAKQLKIVTWRRKSGPSQGEPLCVVAGKIAGDPSQKYLHEWAAFVAEGNAKWWQAVSPSSLAKEGKRRAAPWWDAGVHTLFLGDFNFSRAEITEALRAAASTHESARELRFVNAGEHCEYPTNISPDNDCFGDGRLGAKRIDHIMEVDALPTMGCEMIAANKLLPRLQEEVDVLHCSGPFGSKKLPARGLDPTLWEMEPADAMAWASELQQT